MPIQYINKGAAPNDGTGTPARTVADILNANFDYLLSVVKIKIGNAYVSKGSGNTDLTVLEVGDTFDAWLSNKTRYVEGVIVSAVTDLDADVDDPAKINLVIDNQI